MRLETTLKENEGLWKQELEQQRDLYFESLSHKCQEIEEKNQEEIDKLNEQHTSEIDKYHELYFAMIQEIKTYCQADKARNFEQKLRQLQQDGTSDMLEQLQNIQTTQINLCDTEDFGMQTETEGYFDLDSRSRLEDLQIQYKDSQKLHQETLKSAIKKQDQLSSKCKKLENDYRKLSEKYKRYKIAYTKA